MEPNAVLEHLKTVVTKRTYKTLEAIYEVCLEQIERKQTDFSYTTIARLGEKRGVPKAQSIRNSSGAHYRALIESFSTAVPAKKPKSANAESDAWIDELPTARHRLLVQILKSELAEARRVIREVVPPSLEIYVDDRNGSSAQFKLNAGERRALEHLLSDDFLKQFKLTRGTKGDLNGENGQRVFKPGTLDALEKALRYL